MQRTIRFGLQVSCRYLLPVDSVVRECKLIERLGFHSIFFGDHLAYEDTGVSAPNTWVVLGIIARETSRVSLGMGVTDPHRYHPAVLAQMGSTCDVLSNGRFILGLGAGEPMNLDPYGIEATKPISRLKEAIRIIRRLWSEDQVDFTGEFYRFRRATVNPKPVPPPPIWVAALSSKSIELVASDADGWYPTLCSPDSYGHSSERIRTLLTINKREPHAVERGLLLHANVAEEDSTSRHEVAAFLRKQVSHEIPSYTAATRGLGHVNSGELSSRMLFGSPRTVLSNLAKFVDAGAQHIVFRPVGPQVSRERTIRLLGEKVIPSYSEPARR
ncbi:MAG: LLM class flavin-dependent oxidoreductase [Candidatus Bathyarchaeia archaeon]